MRRYLVFVIAFILVSIPISIFLSINSLNIPIAQNPSMSRIDNSNDSENDNNHNIPMQDSMPDLPKNNLLNNPYTRAAPVTFPKTEIEFEADIPMNGPAFQLYRNSTVVDANLTLTGLPSYNYSLWDECSVITEHDFDDRSRAPAIALDSEGFLHMAWMETGRIDITTTDWDIIYTRELQNNWDEYRIISTEGNDPSRWPDIFLDNSNDIYFVWVDRAIIDGNNNDMDIFYRQLWSNSILSNTEVISKEVDYGNSTNPKIVVNSSGDIFVVWEDMGEYQGNGNDSDIMCRIWHKNLMTWSAIVTLTNYTNDSNSTNPALAVDGENVYIAWSEEGNYAGSGTDQDIIFCLWNGTNWTEPIVISNNSNGESINASITTYNGEICISWEDINNISNNGMDKDIFMKKFQDTIWSDVMVISNHTNDGTSEAPDLAFDAEGNIHIVWSDDGKILPDNNNRDIIYRRWDANKDKWSEYIGISNDLNDRDSIEPRICVAESGCIKIVWADNGNINQSGDDFDIIYKRTKSLYPTNLKLKIDGNSQGADDWNYSASLEGQITINKTLLLNKFNELIAQMTQPVSTFRLSFTSETEGRLEITKFSITQTSTPKKPTNLYILDEAKDRVISHNPTFCWNYLDNDSSKQKGFEVEVSSIRGDADMWSSGTIFSSNEFAKYMGNPLVDNHTYYFRVRVIDPDNAKSPWSSYHDFTMNARPKISELLPKKGRADDYIDIQWVGNDPNDDDLTYTLQVCYNGIWHYELINSAETHYRLNTSGLPSQGVDIRCKCFDGYEYSEDWFNEDGYITIIHNKPPSITVITPPVDGDIANDSYRIKWKSADPDDTEHKIDIYYFPGKNDTIKTPIIRNLPDNGSYLWDTTRIPKGNYTICVIIYDSFSSSYSYSPGILTIDHSVDTNPPIILYTEPAANSHDILISQNIWVGFSKNIDINTLTTESFIVKDSTGQIIEGHITYNEMKFELKFDPIKHLNYGQYYTVTIKASLKDFAGNSLDGNRDYDQQGSPEDDYTWSFSTELRIDITPPSVISVTPEDQKTDIDVTTKITAIFSEEIDYNYTVLRPLPVYFYDEDLNFIEVETSFIRYENKLRIDYYGELKHNTRYTVWITAEVRDLAGLGLDGNKNGKTEASPVDDYQWTFKTKEAEDGLNGAPDGENLATLNIFTLSIILIIFIIIVGVLLKKQISREKFYIHDIFVVYNDGRLLAHHSFKSKSNVEEGTLGGMLTAIQNFIIESFRDTDTEKLEEIKYGKLRIILTHGEHIYLAVVCTGDPSMLKFKKDINNLLSLIEQKFNNVLENWDGNMKKVREIRELIRL